MHSVHAQCQRVYVQGMQASTRITFPGRKWCNTKYYFEQSAVQRLPLLTRVFSHRYKRLFYNISPTLHIIVLEERQHMQAYFATQSEPEESTRVRARWRPDQPWFFHFF